LSKSPRLVNGLQEILSGLSIEFVRIDEYSPVSRNSNGQWLGAFGWVQSNRVDTLETHWYITPSRQETFRFTNPLGYAEFAAFYATQERSESLVRFESLAAFIHWNAYLVALAVPQACSWAKNRFIWLVGVGE
jgi:hypothetical protein